MKELDLLVENYFTPALGATDILRLVEQVMNESIPSRISDKAPPAADKGLDSALATLKDFYKDSKDAPIYHKGNSNGSKTQFSNTGDATSRNLAMQAVQVALEGEGIEMTLDKFYNNNPVLPAIGGSWEIEVDDKRKSAPIGAKKNIKHRIVLAKGSGTGGNTATQFEGNIIVGLYNALGRKKAAGEMDAKLKETGDIIEDPSFQKVADDIGKAPKIFDNLKKGDKITSTSGGKITASLTQDYLNHGVSSAEAKADIAINGVGVSVKKAGGAQFVGAQGPELAAIFDVVMNSFDEKDELGADIDLFVEQLQRSIGSNTKAHVVKRIADIGAELGAVAMRTRKAKTGDEEIAQMEPQSGDWQPNIEDMEKIARATEKPYKASASKYLYQNLLNKFLFKQGGELDATESAMLDGVIGDAGTGAGLERSFVEMRSKLSGILDNDLFRAGLVEEAVTGNGKFNEKEAKAEKMLKWNMEEPSSSSLKDLNQEWFEKKGKSDAVIMKIRARGNERGGAWRGDDNELYENIAPHFTELEIEGINKHAAMIYENMIGDDMLTEGKIKDFVTGKMRQVLEYISNALAKLSAWLKKLLDRGFSYLLSAFGINVEEYSFEINI